jgi:hypothetical protein
MESKNPEQFRLPDGVRTFFTGSTSFLSLLIWPVLDVVLMNPAGTGPYGEYLDPDDARVKVEYVIFRRGLKRPLSRPTH